MVGSSSVSETPLRYIQPVFILSYKKLTNAIFRGAYQLG